MISTFKSEDFDKAIKVLQPFATKNIVLANWQFIYTFTLLWASIAASFYFFDRFPIILFLTVPVSVVFMCRSYVIVHDCGHYSFYHKKIWNHIVGNIMGFGITIPYSMWKFIHNSHHSHVGNLDKRNLNPEVFTLTVTEYQNSSEIKKFGYRLLRWRLMRLTFLPLLNFGVAGRVVHPKYSAKAKVSVIVHNLLYLVIFGLIIYYIGFAKFFFIYLLPLYFFFIVAAFTLYGQHQFEDTYWQTEENWNWKLATINGASDLDAPAWYRWLIGNVVCHTTHHICTTIPNYQLYNSQQALHQVLDFKYYKASEIWRFLGLQLWDEEKQKLVSIKEAIQ